MELSTTHKDRAGGVLLGQAIGDALGVPYEFAPRITRGDARMIGGGLGPYEPGEWSDDTQMALCVALTTARGLNLNTDEGLEMVAQRFIDWQQAGATDIGNQTRQVLTQARRTSGRRHDAMLRASEALSAAGKAGNGALMRTGVVGLVALHSPDETARAAARIASLTHAADDCIDSCVLWSEAVRVAVVDGRLDVRPGLALLPAERRERWAGLIDEAESLDPTTFHKNGWTVTAFQAAWSSIHATRHLDRADHIEAALQLAISIGHDTDTVAAIAGALLGARYGVSGMPWDLARRVHGWPGLLPRDLVRLALRTADQGAALDSTGAASALGATPLMR